MSSDLFYATICLLIGVTTFFFWWHEMFSDGTVGEFSRSFDSMRGKNFIALTIPAIGTSLISGSALAFSLEIASLSPSQSRHPNILYSALSSLLGAVGILSLLVFIVSFIPFSLPEWMYPKYHAARREERRGREAAQRGKIEGRDPFLGDDGVYASQLGNVPIDIPEAVGLPSTTDSCFLQAVPSAEGPPPLQGSPRAGAPALHSPLAAIGSGAGTADAFDTTAAIAALPRTGAPTSYGARPARASRARRSPQEGDATPTTDNATDEPDSTDETEHSSASSEAPSASPQAQPSEESLVRSSEGSQGAGLMESQRELSTGAKDAVESAFAFYYYSKEGR